MSVILICGMHELGHLLLIALFGQHIKEVRLSGYGIRIVTAKNTAEPLYRSIAVLMAGPVVNILMYLLLRDVFPETAGLSLGAGLYNLLPFSQLDGGAAIEAAILGRVCEREMRTALRLLRLALTAASAVMVYIYGMEALPVFAAILVLDISELK